MRSITYSGQFKRDIRLLQKRSKDLQKLKVLIDLLVTDEELPETYADHPLRGNWVGYRDVHIEKDWVLIYKKLEDDMLRLERTGRHVDVFEGY